MTIRKTTGPAGSRGVFTLLALLLVFSPLFRAGNLPLPLLVIELLCLALLVLLLWRWQPVQQPGGLWLVAGGILLLPALYLLPLPFGVWEDLPGRILYASGLATADPRLVQENRLVSLIGHQTEYALWALLPPLVVFVATLALSREQIRRLVLLLIAIALFQATLGLMQFGGGADSWLYFGSPYADGSAAGTYYNRDHLAGFLEMIFPVTLGLFAATVGHYPARAGHRGPRWRRGMAFISSVSGHRAFLYAAAGVLIILALIFTRSRMGVALAMLGLFLSLLAFARRLGGNNVYGTYGTVVAVIVVLAVEIGLAPVLDRFTHDPARDLRWTIYSTASEGVRDFFPLGAGPGTFPRVYPAYQPQEVGVFVNRAHNDFLEWVFDGGLPAALLILAALALFIRQWGRVWIDDRWREFRYLQVGAGIGIVLMLIHTVLDFNLHKPANAIFFAFLLAVFFRENTEEAEARRRKKSRTRRVPKKAATAPVVATPMANPPEEEPDSPLAGW